MKAAAILNLFLLVSATFFAQTDIEIIPPNKGFSVSSYIYQDGSFEVYCGDMVFPYTADGTAKGTPYEFRDDVKCGASAEFSVPGSMIIDRQNDVRYAFEPVTSANITQAKLNPGIIIIDKLGTKNQDRRIVEFKSVVAKESSESNSSRNEFLSYFDQNQHPVFVRVQTGTSLQDPNFSGQKINKNKHNMFIERVELDPKDNAIKVTSHLINKSPIERTAKSNAGMYFVGAMNGKLFVCLDYQDNWKSNVGKVDVWSIDDETGVEKLEYSYSYEVDDTPRWSRGRMPIYSEQGTSGLFFHHNYSRYLSSGEERNKINPNYYYSPGYLILEITPSLEFSLTRIEVPHSVLSHESYPPALGVYKFDNKTCYCVRSTDGGTFILTKEGKEGEISSEIVNVAYKNIDGYKVFFGNFDSLTDVIKTPLFSSDETCNHCRVSNNVCYRVDENNIKRLVYCNDLEDCNVNCKVANIKIRVASENTEK